MKKQHVRLSVKAIPVLAAMMLSLLVALPVKAAPANASAYAAVFDSTYYVSHNPDLQAVFGNNSALLLNHFINCGMAEGRQGNADFNVQYYKAAYPDLQAAFGEDLTNYYVHYIACGKNEGRIGNGEVPGGNTPAGNGSAGNNNSNSNNSSNSVEIVVTPAPSAGNSSDFAYRVVELVNEYRAQNGVGSISATTELMNAAQLRAQETSVSFSHTRPNGSSCFTAFKECGAAYGYAGENIAAGQMSPEAAMQAWINSSGHRANILNSNFKHIGVGCYQGGGGYGIYWTQCFTD